MAVTRHGYRRADREKVAAAVLDPPGLPLAFAVVPGNVTDDTGWRDRQSVAQEAADADRPKAVVDQTS